MFFKIILRQNVLAGKNSLHYLMSVAKQMLATGHCYSGLVTVIAATVTRMTRFFFIQDLFILIYIFFVFSTFYIKKAIYMFEFGRISYLEKCIQEYQ